MLYVLKMRGHLSMTLIPLGYRPINTTFVILKSETCCPMAEAVALLKQI